MLDLPGRDEQEKGDGGVCCRAGAEYNLACVIVPFIATRAEVTSARTDVSDNGEGEET